MHPQCITVEDALEAIDGKRAWICGTQHVLAAEVRRLRGANEGLIAEIALMGASLKKQDAEIAQLQTKLARVEAALSTYRGYTLADKIKEALSDPQPSAAPTPKGEPYNGY